MKLIRGRAFTSSRPNSGRCSVGWATQESTRATLEQRSSRPPEGTQAAALPKRRGSGADMSSGWPEIMHGYRHPVFQKSFQLWFLQKWQAMIDYILKVKALMNNDSVLQIKGSYCSDFLRNTMVNWCIILALSF